MLRDFLTRKKTYFYFNPLFLITQVFFEIFLLFQKVM